LYCFEYREEEADRGALRIYDSREGQESLIRTQMAIVIIQKTDRDENSEKDETPD